MVVEMAKATFKGKTYGRGFDSHMLYLFYEYRGHEYVVYVNTGRGGGDSLSVQHCYEQSLIDYRIAHENDPIKEQCTEASDAIDAFLKYCETGEYDF